MTWKGRAHKFGDHVDTDQIIPARYLTSTDPQELAAHCMEDADPEFAKNVRPGDFVVAGRNFGCGSSREHAPLAIQGCGIPCVIADSFARIFFRNAVNVGLPIMESPEGAARIETGDELEVDPQAGTIRNLSKGEQYSASAITGVVQEIVAAGGLVNRVRRQLEARGR